MLIKWLPSTDVQVANAQKKYTKFFASVKTSILVTLANFKFQKLRLFRSSFSSRYIFLPLHWSWKYLKNIFLTNLKIISGLNLDPLVVFADSFLMHLSFIFKGKVKVLIWVVGNHAAGGDAKKTFFFCFSFQFCLRSKQHRNK